MRAPARTSFTDIAVASSSTSSLGVLLPTLQYSLGSSLIDTTVLMHVDQRTDLGNHRNTNTSRSTNLGNELFRASRTAKDHSDDLFVVVDRSVANDQLNTGHNAQNTVVVVACYEGWCIWRSGATVVQNVIYCRKMVSKHLTAGSQWSNFRLYRYTLVHPPDRPVSQ